MHSETKHGERSHLFLGKLEQENIFQQVVAILEDDPMKGPSSRAL